MCGIAGIIGKTVAPERALLQQMTDRVAHRGPDGEGIYIDGAVGFGHRRLAILDLTALGAQPMTYGESGLTIIHNGEIYNYRELRRELEAKNFTFRSDSDTEVILAAYAAWGEDCVMRFNGMWAFAIHDAKKQRVFCSRDRFGVKPFYYIEDAARFAFGSEIRQLLPLLSSIESNRSAVETFLVTHGNELGEDSFFRGIKRLLPGHSLGYDLKDHSYRIRPYYQMQYHEDFAAMGREEAAEYFGELLTDAVALRLRSDVKVGTCLSGGLDSSSIATIAASLQSGSFAAITAVSEQASNSEAEYAEQVARHAKLDWYQVTPSYGDFAATMQDVVRTQEEPFGSASINMQYFVMQAARANGIPVLLDGQGGDEILLGYERYYATQWMTLLREEGIRPSLQALLAMRRNNARMNWPNIAKYLIGARCSHLRHAYYNRQQRYLKKRVALPQHLKALGQASSNPWAIQTLDITQTNLPILLRFEDKNSMAHGVETRLPFLDFRVVEMALSMKLDAKIHDGWSKWALRRTMDGRMPDSITWRKNKLGFEAPEAIWLTRHAPIMRDAVLASPLLRDMARMDRLDAMWPKLDARSRFRLYSIALWEKEFGVSA